MSGSSVPRSRLLHDGKRRKDRPENVQQDGDQPGSELRTLHVGLKSITGALSIGGPVAVPATELLRDSCRLTTLAAESAEWQYRIGAVDMRASAGALPRDAACRAGFAATCARPPMIAP